MRRTSIRHATASLFLVVAASCSPAAPLPPDPPAVAVTEAPAPPVAAEPDLDAVVPEPPGLTGVLRMGSPIREIAVWRDLLPAHTPFGQLAALGAESTARLVFGSLGEHVDVTAPFDMAFLDKTLIEGDEAGGSPLVGSVVLRDLAEAQRGTAADFELRPRQDGAIDVKPRRGAEDVGLVAKEELACTIFRGGVPRADHLVCGSTQKRVDLAGPYLARTVAQRPAGEGLRIDLHEAMFSKPLAGYLANLETEDDSAMEPSEAATARMGRKLVKELVIDFASAAVQVQANQSEVLLGADISFRSLESPLSVAMVGSLGPGVPASFWRLPSDADVAVYFPGATRDAMRTAVGSLWTDFGDAMPDSEPLHDLWKEFTSKLGTLVLTGGPIMVAHGPPAPAPAKKPNAPSRDAAKRFREARAAADGWWMYALPEPSATWTTTLRELTRIDNVSVKRANSTGGGAARGAAAGGSGAVASTPRKRKDRTWSSSEERTVRPAEKLPAGAFHLVRRTFPNPDYEPGPNGRAPLVAPVDMHLFVAGTADHTWVVMSENEALARTKLLEAMGTTGGIGSRPDLEPLRTMPPGGIGFLTLRGILALPVEGDTFAEMAAAEAERKAIGELPSAGAAPMFVMISPGKTADQKGGVLRLSGALSIAAALDVIRWLQR